MAETVKKLRFVTDALRSRAFAKLQAAVRENGESPYARSIFAPKQISAQK